MKRPTEKISIRLYAEDVEILRQNFPGGTYGEPGISETLREIIHRWVEKNREDLERHNDEPDNVGIDF